MATLYRYRPKILGNKIYLNSHITRGEIYESLAVGVMPRSNN